MTMLVDATAVRERHYAVAVAIQYNTIFFHYNRRHSAAKVTYTSTGADLGMFSMFGRTGAPQKGPPQARECWTAAQHFLPCEASLWPLHLKVHLVQHDILWPGLGVGQLAQTVSHLSSKQWGPPRFYWTGHIPAYIRPCAVACVKAGGAYSE